jgi:hypothetical protein
MRGEQPLRLKGFEGIGAFLAGKTAYMSVMGYSYVKSALPVMLVALMAMGPAREAPAPVAPDEVAPETAAPADPAPAEEAKPELTIHAAGDIAPADLLWVSRPVVVFADSPNDPSYAEQMKALQSRPSALIERDVVVIVDTDPSAASPWRKQLHPRGFSLVVLDKDGQVKLRKPFPWDVREIGRAIDKFPLRRQEIGRAGVLR